MLPALRSAFQKDLNAFSSNLLELRNLTPADCSNDDTACQARLEKLSTFLNQSQVGRSLVTALLITDNLLKGNNAAEVLDNVANDPVCQHADENFSNIVQFANLFSTSLRSKEDGRVWIRKQEANMLVSNESLLKIYLGLLFATEKENNAY